MLDGVLEDEGKLLSYLISFEEEAHEFGTVLAGTQDNGSLIISKAIVSKPDTLQGCHEGNDTSQS